MARIRFNEEKFSHDLAEIRERTKAAPKQINRIIKATMARQGVVSTASMKTNAPWTDRTGAARAGLHTIPVNTRLANDNERHELILSHTVHYGIWLEIANSGHYQIIMPEVRKAGKEVMEALTDIFSELERQKKDRT